MRINHGFWYNTWIEKFWAPTLKPGQVVVMDNATFHKSAKTKQLIENAGCTLLFSPPYSPDLNPIETFWANFKAKIRAIIHNFQTLQQDIDFAFNL
jgi:transposase